MNFVSWWGGRGYDGSKSGLSSLRKWVNTLSNIFIYIYFFNENLLYSLKAWIFVKSFVIFRVVSDYFIFLKLYSCIL